MGKLTFLEKRIYIVNSLGQERTLLQLLQRIQHSGSTSYVFHRPGQCSNFSEADKEKIGEVKYTRFVRIDDECLSASLDKYCPVV